MYSHVKALLDIGIGEEFNEAQFRDICSVTYELTDVQIELAVSIVHALWRKKAFRDLRWLLKAMKQGALKNGVSDFTALDVTAIDNISADSKSGRRFLTAVRRLPDFDHNGTFESHLRKLPRSVLVENPVLWKYPMHLGTQLMKLVPDTADREHLLLFMHALCEARLAAKPNRQEERIRHNVSEVFVFPILTGLANTRGTLSYRDVLPRTMGRTTLIDVVGRVAGNSYVRLCSKKVTLTRVDSKDCFTRILAFFNSAVLHGLFEASGIARTQLLTGVEVRRRMPILEQELPGLICTRAPPRPIVPKCRLTEEDVQRLLSATESCTSRERVVLLLLYTTALRAGAIENMMLNDVWDPSRQQMRDYWIVTEKFSIPRTIRPCGRLSAAMDEYLRA